MEGRGGGQIRGRRRDKRRRDERRRDETPRNPKAWCDGRGQ